MLKSIRIMLAIAAYHDYEIWQMDVKTAFLNKNLEEKVYMTQLERFISIERANQVCKLNKSIYRLKQVSRSWNIYFDKTVKSFSFIKNMDEPYVYKKTSGSAVIFLIFMWMTYCSLKMISLCCNRSRYGYHKDFL